MLGIDGLVAWFCRYVALRRSLLASFGLLAAVLWLLLLCLLLLLSSSSWVEVLLWLLLSWLSLLLSWRRHLLIVSRTGSTKDVWTSK